MALCLPACLAAACSDEISESPAGQRDEYLELNFSVAPTRADLDASGAGSFSEGDRVGLYIDNGSDIAYRELTYTSGAWEPRLQRSDFGEGALTLAAHYPVTGSQNGQPETTPTALADDQSGDGFAASDLLFVRKELPAGENRANLLFTHALHRLRIEITGAEVSAVKVRSRLTGSVNLLTGTVTPTDDSFGWITPHKNSDGYYEAVILPQTAAALRDAEGLLKITTAKGETIYQAPNEVNGQALEEFLAGQQLTLKLSLKEAEEPVEPDEPVDTDWANKKMWFYGITAPVWEENSTEWSQFYKDYFETYYLPWKAEYGWYDCNKTDPTNTNTSAYSDGNLCWAAADSNLLHWWFAQNKTYIDRYGDRYKGPDYHYPLQTQNGQESAIFQSFIDTFINQGGIGAEGINWFINGETPGTEQRVTNEAGYFKEVFGSVSLGKEIQGISRFSFNDTIKDALINRKAIAISIVFKTGGHLETIWGAEFDENGDVSYVYVADNNDRSSFEKYGIGVGRYRITYSPDNIFTYFHTGSIGDTTGFSVKRLTTISLGQELWEEFFRQHPEL